MFTTYKLKMFGEDAFGRVTSRCKAAEVLKVWLISRLIKVIMFLTLKMMLMKKSKK
jgi:hypothetical protein